MNRNLVTQIAKGLNTQKPTKITAKDISEALEKRVVAKAKDPVRAKEWFKTHVIVTKA